MADVTSLSDIQKHLDQTCKERGWDKNSVERVFLLFSEEVGELAKEIRNSRPDQALTPEARTRLESEFADVFNYLVELANRYNVDLTRAYFAKDAVNRTRTWE